MLMMKINPSLLIPYHIVTSSSLNVCQLVDSQLIDLLSCSLELNVLEEMELKKLKGIPFSEMIPGLGIILENVRILHY